MGTHRISIGNANVGAQAYTQTRFSFRKLHLRLNRFCKLESALEMCPPDKLNLSAGPGKGAITTASSNPAAITGGPTALPCETLGRCPFAFNQPRLCSLTPREHQIMRQVVLGRTNKEIAETLRIKETTVKKNMTLVMEKLIVRNRVEAAIRFLSSFLGDSSPATR
jgi:DNA-binding NarL/FixJ family response regulator